MFILHIALQGCLRGADVPYGVTPDTGGHIRYLLELVGAADAHEDVTRQEIVTRRFDDESLGSHYGEPREALSAKSEIVRLWGATPGYLSKERMAGEIDALFANLERHLLSLDRLPDIVHAHYADAGTLALMVKNRFGIPFIFTGHSLGRVKRLVAGSNVVDFPLERRIAAEDKVIAAVDAIVASSRDEAEAQYGLYPAADATRIRINPPGCDLALFGEARADDRRVRGLIDPHLLHPERPMILAVSRPVHKKNLVGLVEAYAAEPGLRDRANLVVFAGCHLCTESLDTEAREVLAAMREAVEKHGLEGHVALPPEHAPADVPAIYRHAAASGGVFANVAFNEPFGLTFLEAAASGLPVVATNNGGPADIVARCGNGLTVDPTNEAAIGIALSRLVSDRSLWERCARSGKREIRYYGWARHTNQYVRDAKALAAAAAAARAVPVRASKVARKTTGEIKIGRSTHLRPVTLMDERPVSST